MSASVFSQKSVQWGAYIIGLIAILVFFTRDSCSASGTSCANLVQFSLNGVLVGGVYALVAVGIVIINKASSIFNFAHGFMMLFGGFMFWQTFNSTPSVGLSIVMGIIAGIIALTVFAIIVQTPPQPEQSSITSAPSQAVQRAFWSVAGVIALILTVLFIFNIWPTPDTALGTFVSLLAVGVPVFTILVLVANFLLKALVGAAIEFGQWTMLLSLPQRLAALASTLITAIVVYVLLQEVQNDILRGVVGALVGGIFLGLVVERFAIRPLLGQPILTAIMMTLALALVMQGTISLIWGTNPHSLPIFVEEANAAPTVIQIGNDAEGNPIYQEIQNIAPPRVLPNYRISTEDLLGKDLSFQRNLVWGFGIAILGFIAFVMFFQFTNVGLAMRAVAENQTLAESAGLRVRTILAVAWAIATTMATIAAVIQGTGPGVGLSFLVIPPLAFRAFPAVLLGGLESITGALVGGLIIGVVETLASGVIDSNTGQQFAPFAVLLIVLIIRPEGLFGQKHIDRV
jgi:branched-chain amino acid transport system permease protein